MGTMTQALVGITFLLADANAMASVFQFAEHTPGYDMFADGTRFYNNGFYFTALNHFRNAAYWADKMAQHNLGVMHYRGEGVDRDPARAWAWFELAAERGYPEFVDVADAVRAELDEKQRKRADAIFEKLRVEYGDEVAVPRTKRRMERERRNVTGSRIGFVGNLTVIDGTGSHDGAHYFAEEKWDFEQVIERETEVFEALAQGNVTIGRFKVVDEEAPESDRRSQDAEEGADSPEDEPTP